MSRVYIITSNRKRSCHVCGKDIVRNTKFMEVNSGRLRYYTNICKICIKDLSEEVNDTKQS